MNTWMYMVLTYAIFSVAFTIYLLGESGTIGKMWEWEEMKRNLPKKPKDWPKAFLVIWIMIPLFIIVQTLRYFRKKKTESVVVE